MSSASPGPVPTPQGWHTESITADLFQSERVKRTLHAGRTPYQEILIHEGACFGLSLILDNKTQSTEVDEFVYHEALVHPAMIAHPSPRRVFIAGGGEGATIREVFAHSSVTQVTMVDLDREVVELCRRLLPQSSRGAFDDPRLALHFADALAFLDGTEERYDVIIVDVPDPLEQGPAYLLYTQEFYRLVRDRLAPGGLMVTHAGPTGPVFYKECFSAVVRTIQSVFPKVLPYEAFVAAFGASWGFVIGSLGPDPTGLAPAEVDRRIAQRISHPLRLYDGITQRGMFSVPKYLRRALAEETRIITRSSPLFVAP